MRWTYAHDDPPPGATRFAPRDSALSIKRRLSSSFATRIRRARRHAGFTQKELADRVGVSQTAVHKIESGRSKSSRRTVAIAMTCGVNPVWLETGEGEMVKGRGEAEPEPSTPLIFSVAAKPAPAHRVTMVEGPEALGSRDLGIVAALNDFLDCPTRDNRGVMDALLDDYSDAWIEKAALPAEE